jgi:hypothetical protein
MHPLDGCASTQLDRSYSIQNVAVGTTAPGGLCGYRQSLTDTFQIGYQAGCQGIERFRCHGIRSEMESGTSDGAASNQVTIDLIASFLHG